MNRERTIPGFFVAIVMLVAACSSSTPGTPAPPGASANPTRSMTRINEGGQVTVVVDWGGPASGAAFDVKLDTHSVDLDALDLANATLRNDRGETMTARPWAAPRGGHHRAGNLSFDGDQTAFFARAKWVELVLSGVGESPERALRWELGS